MDDASLTVPVSCSVPQIAISQLPDLTLVGSHTQLQATLLYADGSKTNVTASASWTSNAPDVASVDTRGLLTCNGIGVAQISASFTSVSTLSTVNCTVPKIVISPIGVLNLVGQTKQVHASASYADGSSSDATNGATWVSSSSGVASIDQHGVMSCNSVGTTTISASLAGGSASTSMSCSVPLIVLSTLPTLNLIGDNLQLHAALHYVDGTSTDITASGSWSSTNSSVALVTSQGILECRLPGNVEISIASGTIKASEPLVCSAPTISLSPFSAVTLVGKTTQLHATLSYIDGTSQDVTGAALWVSSAPGVATINSTGILSCHSAGSSQIAVTAGGVSTSLPLTCSVPQLTFSPPTKSLLVTQSLPLHTTLTYIDGSSIEANRQSQWSSSSSAVASVSIDGLLTCNRSGSTQISATAQGVTVVETVECATPRVTLSPLPHLNLVGSSFQLNARATYSDGTAEDITQTGTWSTSVTKTATVTDGFVTCDAFGSSTISVTLYGASATATLTCSLPTLAISPTAPIAYVGDKTQLSSTISYADGSVNNVTATSSWKVSDPTIATIDNSGVLSCAQDGSLRVTNTYETVSATLSLSCTTPQVTALHLSALPAVIFSQSPFQLQVLADYADGSTKDVTTSAVWSSDASISKVSSSGLVLCNYSGATSLSATFAAKTALANYSCILRSLTPNPGFVEGATTFDGPFATWANVKTGFGAKGDGITDDTAALQSALNTFRQRPGVVWVPKGTYVLSSSLYLYGLANFRILGEDPGNTHFIWAGPSGGAMLTLEACTGFEVARFTWDGQGRAAQDVNVIWSGSGGYYPTRDFVHDSIFVNSATGIYDGFSGELTIARVHFDHLTQTGIQLGSPNALNINIIDSLFTDNAVGITNWNGAGSFNVTNSVFVRSTTADLQMGNTGPFSIRNNLSMNSKIFFETGTTGAPANILFQGNTVVHPAAEAITIGAPANVSLVDNTFLQLAPAAHVLRSISYTPLTLLAVGNTYSVPTPYAGKVGTPTIFDEIPVSVDAEFSATVPSDTYVPPFSHRVVFDVPALTNSAGLQATIDKAVASGGGVIHLPGGNFNINQTVTIPTNADIALIGDGYISNLVGAAALQGPMIVSHGKTVQIDNLRFSSYSPSATSAAIELNIPDSPSTRILCDECTFNYSKTSAILVNGLDEASLELRVATASTQTSSAIVHGGAARQSGIVTLGSVSAFMSSFSDYQVDLGGHFLIEDGWHDGGQGGIQFTLSGDGDVTEEGGVMDSYYFPGMSVESYKGKLSIVGLSTNNWLDIDAVSPAKVLFAGTLQISGRSPYTNLDPDANVAMLASSATPNNQDPAAFANSVVTSSFMEQMLATSRNQILSHRDPQISSGTLGKFERVSIEGSGIGISLVNSDSKSVGVYSITSASGAEVSPQQACSTGEVSMAGTWSLRKADDGFFALSNGAQVMSEDTVKSGNGSSILMIPTPETARDRWTFYPAGDGSFEIVNRATGDLLSQAATGCVTAMPADQQLIRQEWFVDVAN